MNERKLITYTEAAELIGVQQGTLYSMVSRRQIPHIRLSARLVRFDQDELAAWIDARRVAVPAK